MQRSEIVLQGYFPTPYPNETVYSILARYFQRLEGFGLTKVMNAIFQSTAIPPDDLPNNIIKFVNNTPLRYSYTPEIIIDKHTLFNLYATYSGKETCQKLRQDMLSKGRTDMIALAGFNHDQAKRWNTPRFCAECVKEDIEIYGEPYWHREHQILGIKVCPHHQTVTHDVALAGITDGSGRRRSFVALDVSMLDAKCSADKEPISSDAILEKHWRVAVNAWNALNSKDVFELDQIKQKYQARLRERGYSWEGGRTRTEKFRLDFMRYYGEDFLNDIGCTIEMGVQNWLVKTLRGNCFRHPIKQLLVTEFLFETFQEFNNANAKYKPFGDAPWVCLNPLADHYNERVVERCTLKSTRRKHQYGVFSCMCGFEYARHIGSVNENDYEAIISLGHVLEHKVKQIAESEQILEKEVLERLGLSKHCATKRVQKGQIDASKKEPYRQAILLILAEDPTVTRKQIFDRAMKQFQWLRKNDKEWFEQFMPRPSTKNPSEYRNTNWEELDANMCSRITAVAEAILNQSGKPLRITKQRLIKEAKAGTILNHREGYPKSLELLNTLVESRSSYQIRCIRWATEELDSRGEKITRGMISQLAQIQTEASLEVTNLLDEVCKRFSYNGN